VFCGSLCDWLDDDVPIEWMVDLLGMIYFGCHLDWQLLTKRPENWLPRMVKAMQHIENFGGVAALHEWILGWVACSSIGKPPKNVWIGTTVENQEMADKRIPALLKIPARVHFLSCEPLLGPVDLPVFTHPSGANIGVDWVICGGESGKDARPMHPNWARGLREQCAEAGAPYFFKQWGKWAPCIHDAYRASDSWTVIETDGALHRPLAGYEGSGKVMCHCGKCRDAHGRLLDGKEHNGFPVIGGAL
jgi:protein gp37